MVHAFSLFGGQSGDTGDWPQEPARQAFCTSAAQTSPSLTVSLRLGRAAIHLSGARTIVHKCCTLGLEPSVKLDRPVLDETRAYVLRDVLVNHISTESHAVVTRGISALPYSPGHFRFSRCLKLRWFLQPCATLSVARQRSATHAEVWTNQCGRTIRCDVRD